MGEPAFSCLFGWLGVESSTFDHATVQVSRDGSTWTTVWQNSSTITDTAWSLQTIDISAVADNQPQVYIRWGMGPTDSSVTYCGWNIDDVSLSGVGAANSDYYKFSLAANHTATIGLRSLAAGASATLDLYDSAGHHLSSGVSSTNLDSVINNFVAPAADTYYVCITGSGSPYSLVVTKDADFDKEPNDTLTTAQNIDGAKRRPRLCGFPRRGFRGRTGQLSGRYGANQRRAGHYLDDPRRFQHGYSRDIVVYVDGHAGIRRRDKHVLQRHGFPAQVSPRRFRQFRSIWSRTTAKTPVFSRPTTPPECSCKIWRCRLRPTPASPR